MSRETLNTGLRVKNAAAYIEAALRDCLPEGVPPSFRTIDRARWEGTGRGRVAVGHLTMFDGQPATVEVRQAGVCTSHRYADFPGGDASFEGGQWVRVSAPEIAA